MAFLTFAEAKVVAPPILPKKCQHCFHISLNKRKNTKHVQILKAPPPTGGA